MNKETTIVNDIEWTRCPVVWTGGATYFYVAFIPEKRTVIFNTEKGLWEVGSETYYTPKEGYVRPIIGKGFKTYKLAMQSVKKLEKERR